MLPAVFSSLVDGVFCELESGVNRLSKLNELNDLVSSKDDVNLDEEMDKNLDSISDDNLHENLNKSNRGNNRDSSIPITAVTNDRLATNTIWLLLRLMFSIYFHPKTYVL